MPCSGADGLDCGLEVGAPRFSLASKRGKEHDCIHITTRLPFFHLTYVTSHATSKFAENNLNAELGGIG